jgi:hypothetical protein
VISSDGSLDFDGQRVLGELIGDGQNFQHSPVGGLVEREVQRPHLVRELSTEPITGHGGGPHAGALTPRSPHS